MSLENVFQQENETMKPNFVGIVGGILAFVSLVLPWWTMTMSTTAMGVTVSVDLSMYPYQATVSAMGMSQSVAMSWYGWAALALVVVAGILGIVGSVTKYGKGLIAGGGALALLSIIVFAVGLHFELATLTIPGLGAFSGLGLFSSGTLTIMDISFNFTTYLSYGFWIALVAAILILIALKTQPKPAEAVPTPQPVFAPQPPPPSPEPPPPST